MVILVLDNFDSFTYNLVHYLEQFDVQCIVVRNDVSLSEIRKIEFQGLVISPGPETPLKAGSTLAAIDYYHNKIPILGICLGHQAIGEYFGYKLMKANIPKHGKLTKIRVVSNSDIFHTIPNSINVVQYNSLVIKPATDDTLDIIGYDSVGTIMALSHPKYPIFGLQFHPEAALTEYGLTMIKNWLDLVKMKI